MIASDNSASSTIDRESAGTGGHLRRLAALELPPAPHSGRPISSLHAGTDRWRYPDWPDVCQAADRARQRRDRERPPVVQVDPSVRPRTGRAWLRGIGRYGPGTLISLAIHAGLLLALGWWAVDVSSQPYGDARYVIRIRPAREAEESPLQVVEITIPSPAHVQANGPLSQPLSAPTVEVDPGALPAAVSLASFAQVHSGPVGEAFSLFGQHGRGLATVGSGQEGSEFFGVRASGRRFVFVVDCSRSMEEGSKWQDATRELLAALERLGPDQSFYVIFFDGEMHPMFSADAPERDLLSATPENLDHFRQWLETVRLGYYTRPAGSVQLALDLAPDAIFLLSDGVFEDQTAALLRRKNLVRRDARREPLVVVHTIGFHTRDGQHVLQRIADENGGRYVFVPDPRASD